MRQMAYGFKATEPAVTVDRYLLSLGLSCAFAPQRVLQSLV